MRKQFFLTFAILFIAGMISAQVYITKNGLIRFVSNAKLEKIQGVNNQVNSAFNVATGEFGFKVLIKSFEFENALMQEHFNENYMESDQFKLSTFQGKVINLKDINLSKDGTYNAVVEGDLTIHGVTNKVKESGTFSVKGDKITAHSTFDILLKDYKITLPAAVFNKLSESIEIEINVILEKTK